MKCSHPALMKVEEEDLGFEPHTLSFYCSQCGDIIHKFGGLEDAKESAWRVQVDFK